MQRLADARLRKRRVGRGRPHVDELAEALLQPTADDVEREQKHREHDGDEAGYGRPLAGEDAVDARGLLVLPALAGLHDAGVAYVKDEREAHVGDGGARVEPALVLHLADDALDRLLLGVAQGELGRDGLVPLDELARRESHRELGSLRPLQDDVSDRLVAAAQAVVVLAGQVDYRLGRPLLVAGHVQGVAGDFLHALAGRRAYGDYRHAEHPFHAVDVNRAAVARELVHHVQRHHHGHAHLEALHGQVQVALDVGGVHDVDDAPRMLVHHEVAAHQLLARVRRERVDAGKVGYQRVVVPADHAVLAVHRHARKVAHVLVGARQLVEQRGLAAVLVAHQREGERGALRQHVGRLAAHGLLAVIGARQHHVGNRFLGRAGEAVGIVVGRRPDLDLLGVGQAQREVETVDAQFHGIAHRGVLHERHARAGNDPHVQEMLAQGALAPHALHHAALANLQIAQHHKAS